MKFIDEMKQRAKSNIKTICLPEASDIRTIEAASIALKEEYANIILIGDEDKINKMAKENGFDSFSTTLLVSPYQNHEALIEVANEMAKNYGVNFLYRDFRVGFRQGQNKARELGLYMQKYCGCIFSEEDRYKTHIEKDKKMWV